MCIIESGTRRLQSIANRSHDGRRKVTGAPTSTPYTKPGLISNVRYRSTQAPAPNLNPRVRRGDSEGVEYARVQNLGERYLLFLAGRYLSNNEATVYGGRISVVAVSAICRQKRLGP